MLKNWKWSWKLKPHEKNQDGIQEGRTQISAFGQEQSASQMLDREQLAGWIRTEEDPGIIKHCWLSINQPRHPALDRPNTELGLINTRKGMQQLLFFPENNTCCSALASFGVSTSQPALGLFSRMIFTLEFGIPSLEDVEPAIVGEDMQDEQGFCHSSILCCSAVPQRALGSHFV